MEYDVQQKEQEGRKEKNSLCLNPIQLVGQKDEQQTSGRGSHAMMNSRWALQGDLQLAEKQQNPRCQKSKNTQKKLEWLIAIPSSWRKRQKE